VTDLLNTDSPNTALPTTVHRLPPTPCLPRQISYDHNVSIGWVAGELLNKSAKNIATQAMPPVQMAAHRQRGGSPWQSVAAARAFLRWLVGADEWSPALRQDLKAHEVARWLVQNGIGPLAYGRSRELWPELAAALRHDAYSAAAENSFHFRRLQEVVE